jgi:CRP-like cAMP-binding protein
VAAGAIKVQKGHYLFREGDPSEAMFVLKSGKLAVTKSKQNTEIILAEIGPGAMVGEMAFFDGRTRSASVRALVDTEVIALPFKALHTQFTNFPEWAKAIMRTVNDHLREANARIKALESTSKEDDGVFPPHTINKLMSILNLVGHKYGKSSEEGLLIPQFTLRNYTIQIFQEATHKMDKLMTALNEIKLMKVENLTEGKQKILILDPELMFSFVEWHNEWLFKKEEDRITIREEELQIMKAVIHFGKKLPPNAKGVVKLSLKDMQNDSMRDLNFLVKADDVNSLIEKKLIEEKIMEETGVFVSFLLSELEKLAPKWDLLYQLKKFR